MRIAQVCRGYLRLGGIQRHIHMFSEGLKKRGHHVDILSSSPPSKDPNLNDSQITLYRDYGLYMSPGLVRHLSKTRYDVIHVHGYATFEPFLTSIAKRLNDFPLVFTPHFHPFGRKPKVIRKVFDMSLGSVSWSIADRIVVLTPEEERLLSNIKGVGSKTVLIPDPVEDVYFEKVEPGDFKEKWKLREKVILFVGRLSYNKGLESLLKAFKKVKEEVDSVSLLIVGRDWDNLKSKLENLTTELCLNDVVFTGAISQRELLKAYSSSDVFVLCSSYEAFGIVLAEAMAQEVPIVATRVGGIPYVLGDGEYGALVNYGDEDSLARELLRLLQDEKLCKLMTERGKKRANDFKIEILTEKLEYVYEEVSE